jgi:ketosteroid isomerase-like protein
MNRHFSGLAIVCALALPVVATETKALAKPAGEAKRQLLDLNQEWIKAEIGRDAVTLRRILDDRFISTFGTGQPIDKEGFIKAVVTDDGETLLSQTLTDETVLVAGDTAVVVGTDTIRSTAQGQESTRVYRYTVTYIERDGHWLALAEHMVKAPPPK